MGGRADQSSHQQVRTDVRESGWGAAAQGGGCGPAEEQVTSSCGAGDTLLREGGPVKPSAADAQG